MPAAGAAASTGLFEAGLALRWERGRGGEGMEERLTRTNAVDLVHTWGLPSLGDLTSRLALSGVVADVGQGVDSPELSVEPTRKDEGIQSVSERSQGGKPQAEST
jgi:hypothetical protein